MSKCVFCLVDYNCMIILHKGTRRKHNMKFRQIGHTTSQYYYGQLFFPKTISFTLILGQAKAYSL